MHIRPIMWVNQVEAGAILLAVGDEAPPPDGIPVDLISLQSSAIPLALREKALADLMFAGIRKLGATGNVQRPPIVFHRDGVLAQSFANEQRAVLGRVARSARAFEARFE